MEVGDKVRIASVPEDYLGPTLQGKTGVIKSINLHMPWPIEVELDGKELVEGFDTLLFNEAELEKV